MAHRFINLQNELGKPVIAAGTKNTTGGKDFIDISWLNTTDEDGEKVVVDTTLEKVRKDLDKTFTDTTLNVLNEMDSRVKEVASTIDTKVDTAKVDTLNETLKVIGEAKDELSGEIKKVQNEINDTAALVLNTLEPQIETIKKDVDYTNLNIASLTATLENIREALKNAITFEERIINTTNGAYELAKGEKFIYAIHNNESIIPTVKVSDGITTLQFATDGEDEYENVEITIAKKVDFYNASFIPPIQEGVTLGDVTNVENEEQ